MSEEDPTCMEAEHGGHPTCPHIEELISDLRMSIDEAGEIINDYLRREANLGELDARAAKWRDTWRSGGIGIRS